MAVTATAITKVLEQETKGYFTSNMQAMTVDMAKMHYPIAI